MRTRRRAYINDGTTVSVKPGVIDKNSMRAYTHGQCAALAAALVEAGVGVPVFEVGLARSLDWSTADLHDKIMAGAQHVLVKMPDGRLLDIEGTHPGEDQYMSARTTENSQCLLLEMDSADYVQYVRSGKICETDIVRQDVDLAATFVSAILLAYVNG